MGWFESSNDPRKLRLSFRPSRKSKVSFVREKSKEGTIPFYVDLLLYRSGVVGLFDERGNVGIGEKDSGGVCRSVNGVA